MNKLATLLLFVAFNCFAQFGVEQPFFAGYTSVTSAPPYVPQLVWITNTTYGWSYSNPVIVSGFPDEGTNSYAWAPTNVYTEITFYRLSCTNPQYTDTTYTDGTMSGLLWPYDYGETTNYPMSTNIVSNLTITFSDWSTNPPPEKPSGFVDNGVYEYSVAIGGILTVDSVVRRSTTQLISAGYTYYFDSTAYSFSSNKFSWIYKAWR